ncbi:tyrosine--tRNA ligase [Candidatus Woesearchaeota archaeon]|nr:MAG: tyrosine--tRNA ligase [Candidatus Woesearchaeota archaeon]
MNIQEQIQYIARGTVDLITKDDLLWKLQKAEREKRSMVVKYGVDPTAPEMHLGHTVPLRKLKHFQDIGHAVTFLIGDFTARIGDPTGRSSGRQAMTEEEVLANAQSYKEQIFKILNPEKTIIVYNSDWLKPLALEQLIGLLAKNTVNNLIKRKSFVKRFENGEPVAGHELIYPFLQAYDSVALNADVELGGTDQYFNLVFGRDLQPSYGQESQVVVTTPLLEGLDGNEKMSKSLGNTIGLDASAIDMYAKLMQIRDHLMIKYFTLLTDMDDLELGKLEVALAQETIHPLDVKKRLARDITSQYHSLEQTKEAEEEFMRVYSRGELPSSLDTIVIKQDQTANGIMTPVALMRLAGMAESNSEARRLITQRGFSIDGIVIENPYADIAVKTDMILRVGKTKYAKIAYE